MDRSSSDRNDERRQKQRRAKRTLARISGSSPCSSRGPSASLYQYLGGCHTLQLPVPMMNILNGGKHADNTVDLQEFMIMPTGACCLEKGIRMCAEVYQHLKLLLREKGLSTAVGDEGGFAPDLSDSEEVLTLIVHAIEKAGYKPGEEITIAIDAASSELYDEEKGVYFFPGESRMKGEKIYRDAGEMTEYYEKLVEKFPIVSIEDGLWEDDWEGWKYLTEHLGKKIQLVGDDLFVTNIKRLHCGIGLDVANAILIKVNQIGTLTETLDAVEMAQHAGYLSFSYIVPDGWISHCPYRRLYERNSPGTDVSFSLFPFAAAASLGIVLEYGFHPALYDICSPAGSSAPFRLSANRK